MAAGKSDIVKALLEAGVDVDRQEGEYGNALQIALCFPHYDIFHLLFQSGTDENAEGGRYRSPLGAACAAGHLKHVVQLLGKGADPNRQGGILGSPLQAALVGDQSGEHGEIVDELLSKGAKFKPSGGKPLEGGLFETTKRKRANYRSI